jgi:hypothetical protein
VDDLAQFGARQSQPAKETCKLLAGGGSADGDNQFHLRVAEALNEDSLTYHAGCTKDEHFHCFTSFRQFGPGSPGLECPHIALARRATR